jgi:hypothetical protein
MISVGLRQQPPSLMPSLTVCRSASTVSPGATRTALALTGCRSAGLPMTLPSPRSSETPGKPSRVQAWPLVLVKSRGK